MKKISRVFILLILTACGFVSERVETDLPENHIERQDETFTVADFVNVNPGMSYEEVMELFGLPAEIDRHLSGNSFRKTFDLTDGSQMRLDFFMPGFLLSMSIADPTGRFFLFQTENPIARNERAEEAEPYTIADFADVQPGMPYEEVMELLGLPAEKDEVLFTNYTTRTFDLTDGSQMRLLFFLQDYLVSMRIIDPAGRSFVLRSEDHRR